MLRMPPLLLLCALLCPDWPKLQHMALHKAHKILSCDLRIMHAYESYER